MSSEWELTRPQAAPAGRRGSRRQRGPAAPRRRSWRTRSSNKPELAQKMVLKGAPPNIGDYVDAFNEAMAG